MPVFNVSFLNPKMRAKSGGVSPSILGDQLTILEQELGKDGYLSPGDYDILIQKAQEIQMVPGLSVAQKSDYDVKVARYEKAKEVASIDKTEDLERMNGAIKGEAAEDVMMVGNNPAEFLRGKISSQQSKLEDLKEIISRREGSGQDAVEYNNEYASTLASLRESYSALTSMGNFDGSNPVLGYVAYVSTNEQGEIVDVDYSRHGSKQGYAETNGMIDGFQVYGRINYKREGKNFFVMGNNTFQAPDMMIPDASNPGSFKPNKLVANVEQAGPITKGEAGYFNMPGNSINVQSYIPRDSWAKGTQGSVYKRRDDGGYTKYININQSLIDMPPLESMLTLPNQFERGLMRNVNETVDVSAQIKPDEGVNFTPMEQGGGEIPQGPMSVDPKMSVDTQSTGQSTQVRRTPQQPTAQASEGVGPTIRRTINSGVDYVKSLFS